MTAEELENRLRAIPDEESRDIMCSAVAVFIRGTHEQRDKIVQTVTDTNGDFQAVKAELVKMGHFTHWIL